MDTDGRGSEEPLVALRRELDELRGAAAAMRHAQREYFRTRSAAALASSKAAERRLDRLLEAARPGLFESEPWTPNPEP